MNFIDMAESTKGAQGFLYRVNDIILGILTWQERKGLPCFFQILDYEKEGGFVGSGQAGGQVTQSLNRMR